MSFAKTRSFPFLGEEERQRCLAERGEERRGEEKAALMSSVTASLFRSLFLFPRSSSVRNRRGDSDGRTGDGIAEARRGEGRGAGEEEGKAELI